MVADLGVERMSVLFVITGLGLGGAERVVVDLADALFDLGHKPVIAYLRGEATVKPKSGVPLHCLGLEGAGDVFAAALGLRRLIRRYRPDVVHSHLVHANIFARLVRTVIPMRVLVTTAHNTNEESRLRFWAYRATNWLADASTNVSAEAVAAFERDGAMPKGIMRVMHNGIDVDRFVVDPDAKEAIRMTLGLHPDQQLLVAVGRLEAPKDYENLVDALGVVHASRKDWMCAVAGEGVLRTTLERKIEEAGIQDHVRFLGARRDVPALLAAADFFVLSSAWEGFPLVVGEAMACSLPVVATDCGGVAEFVGDESRFLVAPRNSHALAGGLLDALDCGREERKRIGIANRKRIVAQFSHDQIVSRWVDLYRGLTNPDQGVS